jgi:hypothetical protein
LRDKLNHILLVLFYLEGAIPEDQIIKSAEIPNLEMFLCRKVIIPTSRNRRLGATLGGTPSSSFLGSGPPPSPTQQKPATSEAAVNPDEIPIWDEPADSDQNIRYIPKGNIIQAATLNKLIEKLTADQNPGKSHTKTPPVLDFLLTCCGLRKVNGIFFFLSF